MMAHGAQIIRQVKQSRLSILVTSVFVATVISMVPALASLAAAAECFGHEDPVAVGGDSSWQEIALSAQADPVTNPPDCICGRIRSLNRDRSVFSKADTPGFSSRAACLSLYPGKRDRLDQVRLATVGTVKSKPPISTASTLVFDGQSRVLVVRTTPPEMKRPTNKTLTIIIGPTQDFRTAAPSHARSMTYTIPSVPPQDNTSSPFGSHIWGLVNQFDGLPQWLNGESHRMNVTTASVLHGKDCVSDCP
jgi:hypothetical protein